tara:strand:- start:72 stop:740 length:669 start_codon:yes stop_codon:yes gene_type:complete
MQTQLTSNYNKRSNKIYNKTPLKYKDFDVVSIEKRASAPAKSSPIRISTENQFCSNEVTNKDELLTYLETSKINEVSLDNHLHKRTLRLDSILKSNLKSNSDDKILDFSKKAKKYSLISIINLSLTAPLAYIALFKGGWIKPFEILSLLFGISTFIFSTISLFFLEKSIKEIKKSGKKFKETDSIIKKNLRIGIFGAFLCLIPTILAASVLIFFACCFSLSF